MVAASHRRPEMPPKQEILQLDVQDARSKPAKWYREAL